MKHELPSLAPFQALTSLAKTAVIYLPGHARVTGHKQTDRPASTAQSHRTSTGRQTGKHSTESQDIDRQTDRQAQHRVTGHQQADRPASTAQSHRTLTGRQTGKHSTESQDINRQTDRQAQHRVTGH